MALLSIEVLRVVLEVTLGLGGAYFLEESAVRDGKIPDSCARKSVQSFYSVDVCDFLDSIVVVCSSIII